MQFSRLLFLQSSRREHTTHTLHIELVCSAPVFIAILYYLHKAERRIRRDDAVSHFLPLLLLTTHHRTGTPHQSLCLITLFVCALLVTWVVVKGIRGPTALVRAVWCGSTYNDSLSDFKQTNRHMQQHDFVGRKIDLFPFSVEFSAPSPNISPTE